MKLQKLIIVSVVSFVSIQAYAQNDSSAVRSFNSSIKVRVARGESLLTREEVNNTVRSARQNRSQRPNAASIPATLPAGTRGNVGFFGSDTTSVKPLRRKQ